MESVITANIGKSLIDNVVIPLVKDFTKGLKHKWATDVKPLESHFEEYIVRSYRQLSVMNTLTLKNHQGWYKKGKREDRKSAS